MDYEALYQRILRKVDEQAYLPWFDSVDPDTQEATRALSDLLRRPDFDPAEARALAQRLHREGRIDRVVLLSTLHAIAASPQVRDYGEAARLVAEQEQAALELGGPNLQSNLASVERHRGVLAFLQGHYEIALDYFSRAFERQRSAGNLSNVLATLLRLGDIDDAIDLYRQVARGLPAALVSRLDHIISLDPDLARLRPEIER